VKGQAAPIRASTDIDDRTLAVCHLGRISYNDAWELQQALQALLIRRKRGLTDTVVPNFLLTVEHPPVYTLGKSGDEANLLIQPSALEKKGATLVHTDRGGDITYHGPGQLVGYPILDLDRFFTDIGRYLRTLEQVIIDVCASYELSAGRVEGRTGVWIDLESGRERKICAFGIRCSRWVTMHGFAFNVSTELDFYDHIVPCGIADRGVTSLERELGRSIDPDECRERVVQAFARAFACPAIAATRDDLEQLLAEG
jgi:lipoyl(octanoyl) transferase